MSRRTQQQLVEQRFANIRNNKAKKGFKWGFSGKTGWDWLDLIAKLAIPLILGIATLLLGIQQAHLADQQHQSDQQQQEDQQRQITLTNCTNDITDLLLNQKLRSSKPGDEVRIVARAEVLIALRQLDGERKGMLVQFLSEAGLITSFTNDVIIDLSGADLSGAKLSFVRLYRAHLGFADLDNANLYSADLSFAYLNGTNLKGADLSYANLGDAFMVVADLSFADLSNAYLVDTDLGVADLSGATVTKKQLAQAKSLGGATMPDRSIHP